MYDPLTYRFPRTMQEAFGPYATLTIEEDEMDIQDKIVTIASALAAIACVVIIALEGKA